MQKIWKAELWPDCLWKQLYTETALKLFQDIKSVIDVCRKNHSDPLRNLGILVILRNTEIFKDL